MDHHKDIDYNIRYNNLYKSECDTILCQEIGDCDTTLIFNSVKTNIIIKGLPVKTEIVKGADCYYDNMVQLNINNKDTFKLEKHITKKNFSPMVIPKDSLSQYYLSYFRFKNITDSSNIFSVVMSIPESDISNLCEYEIGKNKNVHIREIFVDDEW